MSNQKITDEKDISEILELYNSKMPISKIAKKFNCYHHNISTILKKYKGYKPNQISLKNTDYFNEIDSNIKAYLLGFIAADGAIVNKELTITISKRDRIILDLLKYELVSTNDIQEIHHKSTDTELVRFTTSNEELINGIKKWGITEVKSLNMPNIIENIPHPYKNSFILGYFDGDGSINVREVFINKRYTRKQSVQIRATKEFALGIVKHLDIKSFHITDEKMPNLTISSLDEIKKFYHSLYDNSPFYLSRKKDKFLIAIYRTINKTSYKNLYDQHISQGQTISSSY